MGNEILQATGRLLAEFFDPLWLAEGLREAP